MKIVIELDEKEATTLIEDVFLDSYIDTHISYWAEEIGVATYKDGSYSIYREMDGDLPPSKCKRFTLNRTLAAKAVKELIKNRGLAGLEDADGPAYDDAIQRAVFGEVKYG